jgi:hypothetical protein
LISSMSSFSAGAIAGRVERSPPSVWFVFAGGDLRAKLGLSMLHASYAARPGSLSLPKTRFVRTDVIRPRLHVQRRLPAISRPASPNCLFFIQLYRWFLSILKAMTIIQPETLVRWEFSGGSKLWDLQVGTAGWGRRQDAGPLARSCEQGSLTGTFEVNQRGCVHSQSIWHNGLSRTLHEPSIDHHNPL